MAYKTPYSVLSDAKAFLCWDIFPDLSIQLVKVAKTTSYFYPPVNRCTIIVYYEKACADFSTPLCHLFHEAGHYVQYQEQENDNCEILFYEMMNTPTGLQRKTFEEEAWRKGKELLTKFIQKKELPESILKVFNDMATSRIQSYA